MNEEIKKTFMTYSSDEVQKNIRKNREQLKPYINKKRAIFPRRYNHNLMFNKTFLYYFYICIHQYTTLTQKEIYKIIIEDKKHYRPNLIKALRISPGGIKQ